jgi:predicted nucleotidyltransferase
MAGTPAYYLVRINMKLPSYFKDFLSDIRPQKNHIEEYKTGHKTLRNRLESFEGLSGIIVTTFLQGSYRRATAVRPKGGKRSDVDIIVVTRLSEDEYTPEKAMDLFIPFLEKYYKGKYRVQGRSFGIELSYIDLDLVITSAPSESEEGILQSDSISSDADLEAFDREDDWRFNAPWASAESNILFSETVQFRSDGQNNEPEWKVAPLRIPDRNTEEWQDTHPLEQIRWTWEKNRNCNKHYVNVVKSLKWWRRENHPTPKYPKGYPVEHLIGECCPDGIESVAEGVTKTLEAIARDYKFYADNEITPELPDRGVPEHNVFKRVSGKDFAEFHEQVCEAAKIARQALDEADLRKSVDHWKRLFGNRFPDAPPKNESSNNNLGEESLPFQGPSIIIRDRFA